MLLARKPAEVIELEDLPIIEIKYSRSEVGESAHPCSLKYQTYIVPALPHLTRSTSGPPGHVTAISIRTCLLALLIELPRDYEAAEVRVATEPKTDDSLKV